MTTQKLLRLPDDLAEEVKEYRHQRRLPTEQEAYIELLRTGLETSRNASPPVAKKGKPAKG